MKTSLHFLDFRHCSQGFVDSIVVTINPACQDCRPVACVRVDQICTCLEQTHGAEALHSSSTESDTGTNIVQIGPMSHISTVATLQTCCPAWKKPTARCQVPTEVSQGRKQSDSGCMIRLYVLTHYNILCCKTQISATCPFTAHCPMSPAEGRHNSPPLHLDNCYCQVVPDQACTKVRAQTKLYQYSDVSTRLCTTDGHALCTPACQ